MRRRPNPEWLQKKGFREHSAGAPYIGHASRELKADCWCGWDSETGEVSQQLVRQSSTICAPECQNRVLQLALENNE